MEISERGRNLVVLLLVALVLASGVGALGAVLSGYTWL
jgi:hypothetical protein